MTWTKPGLVKREPPYPDWLMVKMRMTVAAAGICASIRGPLLDKPLLPP